jgi:hypothetical protein
MHAEASSFDAPWAMARLRPAGSKRVSLIQTATRAHEHVYPYAMGAVTHAPILHDAKHANGLDRHAWLSACGVCPGHTQKSTRCDWATRKRGVSFRPVSDASEKDATARACTQPMPNGTGGSLSRSGWWVGGCVSGLVWPCGSWSKSWPAGRATNLGRLRAGAAQARHHRARESETTARTRCRGGATGDACHHGRLEVGKMWSARRPLVPRHGAHGRMSTYRGHAVAAGISATQNMSAVAGANHPVLSGLFHHHFRGTHGRGQSERSPPGRQCSRRGLLRFSLTLVRHRSMNTPQ